MECPKCHSIIDDKSTVCPKCHKVLLLECPNCHEIGDSATCSNCGYTILVKCAKCSKINPYDNGVCSKCGFPTDTSLAYQECETDEFASITVKFNNLTAIRRLLKSKKLYDKFRYKLKNLLLSKIKSVDCKLLIKNDIYEINFNKELSFATSSNKAVRFAIKIVNIFTELNQNLIDELGTPLGLNVSISKKAAEDLQKISVRKNNIKLLTTSKGIKSYLKGTQLILDQYVRDEIHKEYKTDSLYNSEENGKTIMFYEIILDSYVVPPDKNKTEETFDTKSNRPLPKKAPQNEEYDLYSFKIFDINAKCSFKRIPTVQLTKKLKTMDFNNEGKIISLRSLPENSADLNEIVYVCTEKGYRVITVTCTDTLNFRSWGFFISVFKSYFGLPFTKKQNFEGIDENIKKAFGALFDLCNEYPLNGITPDDTRFAYMELWCKFLSIMKNTVILIDGFEKLDDTSIQTLELYFDKFKNVIPNFIITTSDNNAVHSKIKELLRTPLYTEIKLTKSPFESCISAIKSDASDFIGSFYFDKLKENFNGSYLYFKNAYEYLKESDVLVEIENKLIVKDKKSVVLPKNLISLLKARMKIFGSNPDISYICAYAYLITPEPDIDLLKKLGVEKVEENIKLLSEKGLMRQNKGRTVFNNFNLFKTVIENALKKDAKQLLVSNITDKIGECLDDTTISILYGAIENFKLQYETLCSNSEFAITVGDYDAYLKNCFGFLSLIEHIKQDVDKDSLEKQKKEVYNNILTCLYSYAPTKIYFIENILLMDAISEKNDEKIVKLSNLMLQGALLSSNYTDAKKLLHNILSRMENPTLIVNGAVNTKFLLLLLVNIEILYNIGEYKECIETAEDILDVIKPELIPKIKPSNFSMNLFVSHILDTFRLAAFAKLYTLDSDIEMFMDKIAEAIGADLAEKDVIIAIRDYLGGKIYEIGNIESYNPFSKIIFLILQEFSKLENDYATFAQNIYQAKLLALDIGNKEAELFCDLMIAFAYSKAGANEKAESIYEDVISNTRNSSIFNTQHIANFLLSLLKSEDDPQGALLIINDSLAKIQQLDNQAKILYFLFEQLYIKIAEAENFTSVDTKSERQKILPLENDLRRLAL